MLAQLCIEIALPAGEKLHSEMGSIFHGLLMDIVGNDVASWLHTEGSLRPYSQTIYFDRELKKPVWQINCLSESAVKCILQPVKAVVGQSLFLKQRNYNVCLQEVLSEVHISYQALMDEVFLADKAASGGEISFLTTTSFKRDGHYVIMPELYLIFQSLLNRWNQCCEKSVIQGQDLDKELGQLCYITKYQLKSQSYSVNGSNIYGFQGNMRLKFGGNDMTRRILELLLRFAPYAGIGIKTALGMGAVTFSLNNHKK